MGTTAYNQEQQITLKKGASTTIGDYRIVYNKTGERNEKNKYVLFAELEIFRGEKQIGKLFPQSHLYKSEMGQSQRTSEIDMRSNLKEDLYVSLISYQNDDSATFVIKLNPLMNWMWIGGFVITIGVLIILVQSMSQQKTNVKKK
jgi:cytochrome c-type biogenesis protein CcmF